MHKVPSHIPYRVRRRVHRVQPGCGRPVAAAVTLTAARPRAVAAGSTGWRRWPAAVVESGTPAVIVVGGRRPTACAVVLKVAVAVVAPAVAVKVAALPIAAATVQVAVTVAIARVAVKRPGARRAGPRSPILRGQARTQGGARRVRGVRSNETGKGSAQEGPERRGAFGHNVGGMSSRIA